MGRGYEPTGRDFIGGGNQHANTLQLQLRLLSSGIICRHGCSQAVTAQHAYDQFRLRAAGDDRHRYCRTVHDPDSLLPSPSRAYWQHGRAIGGRPHLRNPGRGQSAVPAVPWLSLPEVRQMALRGSIQACRHPPIDILPVDLPVLECGGGQPP